MMCRYIHTITPRLEALSGVPKDDFEKYDKVVEDIFVTDITATLIAQDYSCSLQDAHHMAWLSDLYGEKEFPYIDDCSVLASLLKPESREVRMIMKAIDKHEEMLRTDDAATGVLMSVLPFMFLYPHDSSLLTNRTHQTRPTTLTVTTRSASSSNP